ncbi:GNAT family N-acetyltransferase [Alkalicoccobacillus murimartini]|uniref:GNAT superfamily N-acetyltransferase n=1 Tax=Alkalicoccobacillus murimartini TaxID=171685 RepID=A0ABT9YLW8_9BACI|nr:GNAT family N-acetyltransferase [Alkalicoccobacillus murimartini]MDQ0208736.1 GNAT superfamily N-acetyltransferase [Alkalicoccobacillus murimartini]
MDIIKISNQIREQVSQFFESNWGTNQMVLSSGIYNCSELKGFVSRDSSGDIVGLITYVLRQEECEIISLDSLKEGKGIGTGLLSAVEEMSQMKGCTLIKLVTTNDNIKALSFYQKREYRLSRIIKDAVTDARKLKPEIPLVGNYEIPLHDEIELVKCFS